VLDYLATLRKSKEKLFEGGAGVMKRECTHKRMGYAVPEDRIFRNQRHDIKKSSMH
jgi:hypothetical protein